MADAASRFRQRARLGHNPRARRAGMFGVAILAVGFVVHQRGVLDPQRRYRRFRRLHGHLPQPDVLRRLVRHDAGGHRGNLHAARRQFLAAATIVVYAGAIVVTFLFVLMLAQPRGDAYYDRVSWEGLLAAATGAVLLAILSLTIGKLGLNQVAGPAADALASNVLTPEHVARLGGELFGRHLIAVEVAGTLLLVALVGATAVVSAQRGGVPPKTTPTRRRRRPNAGGRAMNAMHESALLQNSLLLGAALFSIGLVGFLSRRNMIVMFLCAEMMLQGVSISLVAWGRWHNNWDGQVLGDFYSHRRGLRSGHRLGVVSDAVPAPRRFGYRRLGRSCAKAIARLCRSRTAGSCRAAAAMAAPHAVRNRAEDRRGRSHASEPCVNKGRARDEKKDDGQ